MQKNVLCALALTLIWAGLRISPAWSTGQVPADAATNEPVIHITNYESTRVLMPAVPHDGSAITIASQTEVALNTVSLADTMNAYNLHWRDRKAAVSVVSGPMHNVQWVSTSPDMRMAVAGYEDPSSGLVTHASLVDLSSAAAPYKLDLVGTISDVSWVPGTHIPLILESTEYMRKSPWGLLAAISGHPIEMQQYFIDIVDPVTHGIQRAKLGGEVENAIAVFR